jgi:hypothetical protein
MKYLDNLIAWADGLFRQDTLETLNEATQLYILATQILGPRPEEIDTGEHPPARTFSELEESLDEFSNALVELENHLGFNGYASTTNLTFGGGTTSPSSPPLGTILYFCIPKNEKLVGYWDTVEDRLFKIRHCMNIEGVVRELPLFAPPIEPGLLVQAAAAGIDISSAVNDLHAPLGPYRFRFLVEKALEFNTAVKALGSSLLDALTQRDGEVLAKIRAAHEVELLKMIRETKQRQITEAGEQVAALRSSHRLAEERELFYQERPDRIAEETEHLDELEAAGRAQDQALSHDLVSADAARFIPDFALGWSGMGPLTSISLGRANVLAFFDFRSREKSATATKASHESASPFPRSLGLTPLSPAPCVWSAVRFGGKARCSMASTPVTWTATIRGSATVLARSSPLPLAAAKPTAVFSSSTSGTSVICRSRALASSAAGDWRCRTNSASSITIPLPTSSCTSTTRRERAAVLCGMLPLNTCRMVSMPWLRERTLRACFKPSALVTSSPPSFIASCIRLVSQDNRYSR